MKGKPGVLYPMQSGTVVFVALRFFHVMTSLAQMEPELTVGRTETGDCGQASRSRREVVTKLPLDDLTRRMSTEISKATFIIATGEQ